MHLSKDERWRILKLNLWFVFMKERLSQSNRVKSLLWSRSVFKIIIILLFGCSSSFADEASLADLKRRIEELSDEALQDQIRLFEARIEELNILKNLHERVYSRAVIPKLSPSSKAEFLRLKQEYKNLCGQMEENVFRQETWVQKGEKALLFAKAMSLSDSAILKALGILSRENISEDEYWEALALLRTAMAQSSVLHEFILTGREAGESLLLRDALGQPKRQMFLNPDEGDDRAEFVNLTKSKWKILGAIHQNFIFSMNTHEMNHMDSYLSDLALAAIPSTGFIITTSILSVVAISFIYESCRYGIKRLIKKKGINVPRSLKYTFFSLLALWGAYSGARFGSNMALAYAPAAQPIYLGRWEESVHSIINFYEAEGPSSIELAATSFELSNYEIHNLSGVIRSMSESFELVQNKWGGLDQAIAANQIRLKLLREESLRRNPIKEISKN